jgi:alpha-glucosidase (family GH31 glycosyl hydrolase)
MLIPFNDGLSSTSHDNIELDIVTHCDIVEFYVIMRGTAKAIIKWYQHQLGYPSLPPFYALGIFTGSQMDPAWADTTQIQSKIDAYIAANMPIEGVILD